MSAEIQKLYIAYFNRPADPGGLSYWAAQLAGGATMTQIANSFSASAEYQAIYAGKSNLALIDQLYQNLFGRTADVGGLLFWSNEMAAGRVTITTVASALSSGTTAGSADNIAINSKIAAASAFTAAIDTAPELIAYSGSAATSVASAWLSTVTNAATLATAIVPATLNAAVASTTSAGSSSSGQTFTLTTGMDNVPGTSGNDQIYGTVSTSATLNSFDVIDGGSGTDTLNVTLNGASYAADSTIRNIEVINVRASTAHNFNANALTGVTNMTLEGSVAASSFTNVGSAATTIGMRNIADAAADLSVLFSDAALTGTNDTVTVNLNAAGDTANRPDILIQATNSTNGAEALNVVTSGTASFLGKLESTTNAGTGAANATLKTLTITGDKNLTVTTILEFAADTGTVDASALTGKLSIGLDVGGIVKVTGGTADDTLSFTTGLTVDDTVDGGAGVDTLSVTNMDTFTLASFTKLTNIEVIDQQSTTNVNQVLTTGGAALTKVILRENATTAKNITASDLAAGVAVELVQTTDAAATGILTLGLKDAAGTSDSVTLTLKGVAAHGTADNAAADLAILNVETLNLVSSSTSTTGGVLAAADANLISDISSDTTLATINASGSSALTVVVGAEATKLTKFDASSMTADLALTLAAGDVAVTGGAGDDTFTFAATLNNKDTVVGGANSLSTKEDLLTATVTGLTATTGALSISGVERINLTNAGTAVIDATKITGATEIGLSNGGTSTTVSGLAAGSKLGLGFKSSDPGGDLAYGSVTVSLADEAGTADSITFNLNTVDTANAGDVHTVTLKTTAIETVNLAYSTTATALAGFTVTSTDLKASTINVTGSDGDANNVVTLGTVNAATTKVDASTFKGKLIATAATDTATAILANGLVANNITGGDKADVVTIGAATATLVQTVAGGAGTDTLNISLKTGNQAFTSISAFEVINITVADSAAVAMTNVAGINDAALTTLTITGGNSLSTFTNTAAAAVVTTALTKIDTSGFKGDASLFFTDDALTSVNVITGGASTKDTVNTIISNSANTFKMSGIETLSVQNTTGASSINLADSTGLTTFILNDAAAASGTVTLTNFDLATRLTLGAGVDSGGADATDVGVTVVVTGASTTGAADTLNVTVQDIDTSAIVQANGVETINLKIAADAGATQTVSVSDTNATNKYALNVTDGTTAVGFTLGGLTSDATSVNGSTFIGNLTFTAAARAGTTAMTITGGVGTDALNMKHANDVIDGGTGTDTLSIAQNAVLGGFLVDLSSTVDQVTTYNGSANSAVQKGFENVDLSGITGTFGADITARAAGSTITGTINADVITGGAGADVFYGGLGADTISLGSGATIVDEVNINALVATPTNAGHIAAGRTLANVDKISGFLTGVDKIDIDGIVLRSVANSETAVTTTDGINDLGGTTGTRYIALTLANSADLTTNAATALVMEITTAVTGDFTTQAGIDAALATGQLVGAGGFGSTASGANANTMLVIVYDSQTTANAALFSYTANGTTGTDTAAADFTLIGVFTGVGAGTFAAGDFI